MDGPEREPQPENALGAGLVDTLGLLSAQARAVERILPPESYQARAAVTALGELGPGSPYKGF